MSLERLFVFDTNVLVSAFLFKKSVPRQALDLAIAIGQILHSDETLSLAWSSILHDVRPQGPVLVF